MRTDATRTQVRRRAGKVCLNVEIDPRLRDELNLHARCAGQALKDWLPDFLRSHLPHIRIVVEDRG